MEYKRPEVTTVSLDVKGAERENAADGPSRCSNSCYHLQLAHTTNIGFSYEIDKASIETDAVNGSIFYLGDYYKKGSKLAGNYLNKETESNYATNAYHEKTYEKYGNVQISAEPLYWKTASQEKLPDERQKPDKNGNYVNYYILHITWDETVQNNKETDMIYIMAG